MATTKKRTTVAKLAARRTKRPLTAKRKKATLISSDLRAQPTYEAMDVQAQFVDPE
jgi:hypothetical protein